VCYEKGTERSWGLFLGSEREKTQKEKEKGGVIDTKEYLRK
jgi:ribosome biogenesis protein Nip4